MDEAVLITLVQVCIFCMTYKKWL